MPSDFEIRSKLRSIYMELSEEYNFHCPCYLDIVISNKLRSCNGYIETTTSGFTTEIIEAKVTMSKALLNEFDWERFEKTFRHEMAHLADEILNNHHGHGHSFKRLCLRFGGSMNTRMAGSLYSECAEDDFVRPVTKWIYTCPCGHIRKMAKRMAKKKRGSPQYRCGACKTHRLSTWIEKKVG